MKFNSVAIPAVFLVVFLSLQPCISAIAQEDEADAGGGTESVENEAEELRGVVRVSWELIDAFADEQVSARVPFQSPISRGTVGGYVETRVDMTIQPQPVRSEVAGGVEFLVTAEGNASGYFVANAGKFRISGPIAIPFRAQRPVAFDGRYFTVGQGSVAASVRTSFTSISACRNGLLGRFVARLAAPAIRRERPATEREASPIARGYVEDFIDRYSTDLVAQLNDVTPVEQSLFRLYPEMEGWRIRVTDAGDYLEARYAPPEADPVQLPREPHDDAAIEIWIRTTAAEARFLERLGNWRQSQDLLAQYLPEAGTDAGQLTSETSVQSFGPWFALLIGRVPAGESPAIQENQH